MMSDFFPVRSDPRSSRLSGSLWFSNRKQSAMLASGRDYSDMNSCVTKIMLCRCMSTDPLSSFFPQFGSNGESQHVVSHDDIRYWNR